jgi:hypothetical protein
MTPQPRGNAEDVSGKRDGAERLAGECYAATPPRPRGEERTIAHRYDCRLDANVRLRQINQKVNVAFWTARFGEPSFSGLAQKIEEHLQNSYANLADGPARRLQSSSMERHHVHYWDIDFLYGLRRTLKRGVVKLSRASVQQNPQPYRSPQRAGTCRGTRRNPLSVCCVGKKKPRTRGRRG